MMKFRLKRNVWKIVCLICSIMLMIILEACGHTGMKDEENIFDSLSDEIQSVTENINNDSDLESEIADIFSVYEFNKNVTIEETILVDENGVKITATELTYSDYAAELKLVIENNTEQDLSFVSNGSGYRCNSINGYMVSNSFSCDVAAGKKAIDTFYFRYEDLMSYGIFEIADIEIGFGIYDKDYNATYMETKTILTSIADSYDYGKFYYRNCIASKEAQKHYEYTINYFSDECVYDNNGISIESRTLMTDVSGEKHLLLEIINHTNKDIKAITSNIGINGLGVYNFPWSYSSIRPDKTAIVDINLSYTLQEEYWAIYGIEEIDSVEVEVSFEDNEKVEVAKQALVNVNIMDKEITFSKEGKEIYNKNGIKIISKGVCNDSSEYSDDIHVFLFIENLSGNAISLSDVYDSLSINDYMVKYSFLGGTIENDVCQVMDIELWDLGLEDINVSEASDVEKVEFSIEIRDLNYKEIDTATLSFSTN